jgi:hypothetical protein
MRNLETILIGRPMIVLKSGRVSLENTRKHRTSKHRDGWQPKKKRSGKT